MATGNLKGPLGPIMLALLIGIAIFMLFVVQSPDLASKFKRPDGFYDNIIEKIGTAILFAAVTTAAFILIRKSMK